MAEEIFNVHTTNGKFLLATLPEAITVSDLRQALTVFRPKGRILLQHEGTDGPAGDYLLSGKVTTNDTGDLTLWIITDPTP